MGIKRTVGHLSQKVVRLRPCKKLIPLSVRVKLREDATGQRFLIGGRERGCSVERFL